MILSVHLSICSGNIKFSLIFVLSHSGIALTIHGSSTIHGSNSAQYYGANVSDVMYPKICVIGVSILSSNVC